MDQYYKPSGKFSPSSILLFILTSVILLPLLAVAYAYSIWYMPIIYLAIIMTGLFGIAIGFATGFFIIKWGKVRNTTLGVILGFLTAFIALYLHWAFWLTLVVNSGMGYSLGGIGVTVSNVDFIQALQIALQPERMLSLLGEINAEGTWTLKGGVVKGTFLSVIWAIEALVVFIFSIYLSYRATKKPFSEENETWFKEQEINVDLIENKSAFISSLEKAQYEVLDELKKNAGAEDSHSALTLYYTDTGNFYLSGINKFASIDENKKIVFSNDPFVEYILIDAKHGQKLLTLA